MAWINFFIFSFSRKIERKWHFKDTHGISCIYSDRSQYPELYSFGASTRVCDEKQKIFLNEILQSVQFQGPTLWAVEIFAGLTIQCGEKFTTEIIAFSIVVVVAAVVVDATTVVYVLVHRRIDTINLIRSVPEPTIFWFTISLSLRAHHASNWLWSHPKANDDCWPRKWIMGRHDRHRLSLNCVTPFTVHSSFRVRHFDNPHTPPNVHKRT